LELLHGHLHRLPGEAEEPSEFGDMHLPIGINRFESSVLSECDPERLERLIHEDLYAVLKAAHGGDDLPTGGEAVVLAHRMSSYLAGVTVRGGSRPSRCDVKMLTDPAHRLTPQLVMGLPTNTADAVGKPLTRSCVRQRALLARC
jgi:hypothetical protein